MRMITGKSKVCFERAKEGFVHLLGEGSAKAFYVAFMVASQIRSKDEQIAELRQFWEMAKDSLPEGAVSYNIANKLGGGLYKKGKYEEAKVLLLAAFEGAWRVLGGEHKDTLDFSKEHGCIPLLHGGQRRGARLLSLGA